jgi:hypothetical protein
MPILNPRAGRPGGIWAELYHSIIAGAAVQNVDIPGLSIGPTGTYKRYRLFWNILNSSGFAITAKLYYNGDFVDGGYDSICQGVSQNIPYIVKAGDFGIAFNFAGRLESGDASGIDSDTYAEGIYARRDVYTDYVQGMHRRQSIANITSMRIATDQASGIGIASEFLLLGLLQ